MSAFLKNGSIKKAFRYSYGRNFNFCTKTKIRSFYEDSFAILISFKSVVIFADFVLISAKMTLHLQEMRIAQLSS